MTQKNKRVGKQRLYSSYATSTISITMVLFLVGLLALVIINTQHLSDYVREKIGFTLVLHDGAREVEIIRLQKLLNSTEYIKSTRYVDKETAALELQEDLGEDFTGFLGFNPLFSSIEVKLFAEYTSNDSLFILKKRFLEFPEIKEAYYQQNLVTLINENLKKVSLFLIFFSSLLGLIFFALINNTIRIAIYSQRFVINTMKLVGATRGFIRKPFIKKSLILGMVGACLAFFLIFIMVYAYQKELAGLISINSVSVMSLVFIIILFTGLAISWFSTLMAVNKFLRLKFDELFY